MTLTIPNRPLGTDQKSIEAVLADFDALLSAWNGSVLNYVGAQTSYFTIPSWASQWKAILIGAGGGGAGGGGGATPNGGAGGARGQAIMIPWNAVGNLPVIGGQVEVLIQAAGTAGAGAATSTGSNGGGGGGAHIGVGSGYAAVGGSGASGISGGIPQDGSFQNNELAGSGGIGGNPAGYPSYVPNFLGLMGGAGGAGGTSGGNGTGGSSQQMSATSPNVTGGGVPARGILTAAFTTNPGQTATYPGAGGGGGGGFYSGTGGAGGAGGPGAVYIEFR